MHIKDDPYQMFPDENESGPGADTIQNTTMMALKKVPTRQAA